MKEFYHLLNRGVDKRNVVLDEEDRVRFMHDLFIMNDRQFILNFELPERKEQRRPREMLVDIHCFCLMKNHYHLLVTEAAKDGISLFMKKLNMGYARYFNEKYKRTGALWQGKYKKKLIQYDAHFLYIPYYIHLNPLDFYDPEWREGKIKDVAGALNYLKEYRWSSHLDYMGEKNFPSITNRDFFKGILKGSAHYKKEIASIIQDPGVTLKSATIE